MQSQVDALSPVLIAVKVEVPPDAVTQDLTQAFKRVQKTAKIRGFRPGKVPLNVVKKLMGPSVRNEVANQLVQKSISSAIDEHSLDPVAIPEVDAGELVEGESYTFTAKMEIRPAIEELKLDDLKAERTRVRVSDEAVNNEIERLRGQNGELVSPEPARPTQSGDLLTISVSVTLDGEPREDLSVDETQTKLGEGRLLPELEEGLTGIEAGQEKTIDVTFPADYGHEELQNKTAQLKVVVKDIQENRLPELDDEFAKDLEYENLDAMRAAIRTRLEETADQRADSMLKDAVVQKLIADNEIPVPPSMVERQHRGMLQEMMQFQRYMGQPLNLDDAAIEEMKGEAERKVRAGLLFAEIAKRENMAITDEEVQAELEKTAERTGQHIAKVRAETQGQARQQLESRLLENKLLEYLLSKATITESEVDEEAPAEQK